jgi:hypothetical protein
MKNVVYFSDTLTHILELAVSPVPEVCKDAMFFLLHVVERGPYHISWLSVNRTASY